MNRRRLLGIAALAAVTPLLAACPSQGADGGVDIDVEDCDAEDRRNREPECGYPSGTPSTRRATNGGTTRRRSTNGGSTGGRHR